MHFKLKICPKCNVKLHSFDKFCVNCGYDFSLFELYEEFLEPLDFIEFIPSSELFNIDNYFYLFENIDENLNYIIKLIRTSDWKNALLMIDKSLEITDSNANLWALKSYILFKLKYFEDAFSSVNISLNLDDFNELAWACKAIILYVTREYIPALSCCDEFLNLNSTNSDIIKLKELITVEINKPKEEHTQNHIDFWDLKITHIDFKPKRKFKNHLTEIKDIITGNNIDKLGNISLTPKQYDEILDNIKSSTYDALNRTIYENNINLRLLSTFEKVLLFTRLFIDVEYKFKGSELGSYDFNKINLEDRLDISDKIITLIHELSHHLLTEIFEQAIMIILDTDKTHAIKLFVKFFLLNDRWALLLNEYCAHTVAGRFTPYGYQNYGSFKNILNDNFDKDNDAKIIFKCKCAGNTFSNDLISIIDPFLDDTLREEIKQEFKKDLKINPHSNDILLEIKDSLDIEDLIIIIYSILDRNFNIIYENPKILYDFEKKLNN